LLRPQLTLARAAGALSRRSGRGGGTSLPGKLLLRLKPDAIEVLGAQLGRGSIVISATNGKTTTAAMVAGVLRAAGIDTVHNRAGANMPGGVAAALAAEARGGRIAGSRLGLFEVDEAWLGTVVGQLSPHTVVLGNLFRDQLDRYGELESLADDWAALVQRTAGHASFVLNADDPLVADLGRDREGAARPGVTYFGVDDPSHALPAPEHAFDAKHCRRCGHMYSYRATYLGHLGDYECPNCGNRRPAAAVVARRVQLDGMRGSHVWIETPNGSLELSLPLPGLYNVYNALAAVTTCLGVGIALEHIRAGLESVAAAFGRAETIDIGGRPVSILLIKNPAGANEVFRTLTEGRNGSAAAAAEPVDLWIALNDGIADGRDVSWIWDADFELLAGRAARVTCAGSRAEELALRLKYAGVESARLHVVPDVAESFDTAVGSRSDQPLYALPTYTALLELRDLLADRGDAPPFWR
jgi:UDP-N-acetylmuramyl tripeptide synthase